MIADTRNRDGTFAKGNPGGPGRPRKAYEASRQAVVFRSVPDETVARIIDVLVTAALQGDVQAAKAVLSLVLPAKPDPFELLHGDGEGSDCHDAP
jgi:hypothetical protein